MWSDSLGQVAGSLEAGPENLFSNHFEASAEKTVFPGEEEKRNRIILEIISKAMQLTMILTFL